MARLKVRLRGKPVHEVTLQEDRAYIAGRKEDCDIVLLPEKGISREHFKIAFQNGGWTVEVVSRYGEVFFNGDPVPQFALEHNTLFSVPPYEFEFSMASESVNAGSDQLPAVSGSHESEESGPEEKTVVGVAPSAAYIKITDAANDTKELIRLEAGDTWVAGRESSCHIYIKDPRVSRRQFEVRRSGSQYTIIDLSSVNGTLVNGNPISSSEPTVLRSGDAIVVLDNYLYFELHDAHFQSRLDLVVVSAPSPLMANHTDQMPMAYGHHDQNAPVPYQYNPNYPQPYQQGAPAPVMAPGLKGKFDYQKNRVKLIAGAVALLVVAYFFSDSGSEPAKPVPGAAAPGSAADLFAKLKPEQQGLVRQRYKDAKNLYMQGKYQLAQDEIVKIQEIVPDFEDIKEIERLSKEAIFIQEQQRRNDQIEKDRAESEAKIQKQALVCEKLVTPNVTMAEMDECLTDVIVLNPEHPKILNLKGAVEAMIANREAKDAERAAHAVLVAKLKSLYDNAQSVHKKGKPLDAITAYEKVVESKLPDPNGYKGTAGRSISSIRQEMNTKTAALQAEAEQFYQAQNLKGAILSLRKARGMDPTNEELPVKIEHHTSELRKQMMNLYQEGILEESFGNVDGGESKAGAKDKWKKILELDVSDGEYYKKAYIKLKKYGAL
jgi:pSer/pThr/pTyr-binding forkhead associated (FHA) protein/tetratricopeptide (TPR) repeat protein